MEQEFVLKLHQYEVALIVDALKSERERASKMIAMNGREQDALDCVKQSIDEILHRIDNDMVCID